MGITSKKLAQMLGLSEAAVSLALNGKPGVSRETRRRVLDAAQAHDFDFSRKGMSVAVKKGVVPISDDAFLVTYSTAPTANHFTTSSATPSRNAAPAGSS